MAEEIAFHRHEVTFRLPQAANLKAWIKTIVEAHERKVGSIGFVFCSDDFLLNINRQFLQHDYLTDIITFDLSDRHRSKTRKAEKPDIHSEIYISIDRVRENAASYNVSFSTELCRVIIHGVLHLLGNKDKNKGQKALMRQKEEACLSLLHVPRGTWKRRAKQLFHVEH